MESIVHNPTCRRTDLRRPCLIAAFVLTAILQTGCADWSYRRIQLGQQLGEYQRAFPEARSRRTDSTLCCLEQDVTGRTDAVVVLLTRDRQVSGKLHATHFERNYGFRVETGYLLRGELDPELTQLRATGPVDTLRAIADELTSSTGDKLVKEAHGWVAAGIVRLVQRWPHVGDQGPAFPRLTDMLERVPGGGTARITVNERGAYVLEYRQGTTR